MTTVISGTAGVTFPAGGVGNPAGAVVGTTDTQTLTNKTIQGGAITSGTAVASTSGTSIDFTSIPSWVKRITVMFSGVSTNGTSNIQVQLGAGSVATSGYLSNGSRIQGSSATTLGANTAGFTVASINAAADAQYGLAVFCNISGNIWVSNGILYATNYLAVQNSVGQVSLGGVLDRVRITTANGTDTFDAGRVNILYEG